MIGMKRVFLLFAMTISCMLNMSAQSLSQDEINTIEQRIEEKVNDFISYLPEIAAKSDKSDEEKKTAKEYIKIALKLFIGEGEDYQYVDNSGTTRRHDAVKMQTTSRGVPNKPQPMKRYLNRLMALPYTKVEVDTVHAVRIDRHLFQTGENTFTATASFLQAFRSYRDGRLIINDKDVKQVTVYVTRVIIDVFGKSEVKWEIQLGDIKVTSKW